MKRSISRTIDLMSIADHKQFIFNFSIRITNAANKSIGSSISLQKATKILFISIFSEKGDSYV